jgi:hypothetical protein
MIAEAFAQAAQTYASLAEAWIRVSHRLGGALPNSLLGPSVQRDGRLDLVLRCMEDEHAAGAQGPFEYQYQRMFSEVWVGSVYETLRLLTDDKRKLIVATDEVLALAEDLRLVRVSLEKHEVASDRKLDAPLQLQRVPPNNDHTDLYEYSKGDPQRAHIMPTRLSRQGSVEWLVIDVENDEERWIERLALSDRIIAARHSGGGAASIADQRAF